MNNLIDRVLFDNFSKAVAFFNDDGMLTRNNPAWEMICRESMVANLVLYYDDFIRKLDIHSLENDQIQDICEAACGKKTVRILQRRISNGTAHGIMIEVEDISNSKQSLLQGDRILADTMWKIRSRIASVQNVLTLLVDYRSSNFDPELLNLLVNCRREVWELERQAENLRYLMQVDLGQVNLTLQPELLNVARVINDTIILCEPLLHSFENRPVVTVSADPSLQIFSDRQIIQKAISSLLFNALIYNDSSKPVQITAHVDIDSTSITVKDEGWGIPESEQPSIVSYTFRGTNARRSPYCGLGIELYLVRRLLTLINAGLEFISKENGGSQFTLFLRKESS